MVTACEQSVSTPSFLFVGTVFLMELPNRIHLRVSPTWSGEDNVADIVDVDTEEEDVEMERDVPSTTKAATPSHPMAGGGVNGFGPPDAERWSALQSASTLPTSKEVIKQICSDLPTFHGMWDRLRQLAIGHMRVHPPARAILDDYQRMLDVHIPILLDRVFAWRSSKTNRVVLIKFTGVRYVRPDNMRSTNIGRERFKDGLTAFERAQKRRWAYCLYVMVNVETTTINCDPDFDLTQALDILPEEHGDITPEQEALLHSRARVQRNKAIEAPLFKMPMPRGAEAHDDPERIPASDPRAGEFFVNKSLNVHRINVPVTNRAIPIVVKKNKKSTPALIVKVYSHTDGTYRSTATMSFHTDYDANSTPNISVKLAYPRKQMVSLYECFMILHVNKVGWIMRLMWPNGVPAKERLVFLATQAMFDAQARDARRRGVFTREDMFSTLEFPKVVDGDEDDVDSYSELKRYQRAKDSTVAELLRQQGTRQIRTTMIAKAISLAQFAKTTVLVALGHQKPCNPYSSAYVRQQFLSFFLATLLSQRLRNYVIPVIRRSVRSQVVQGGTAALSSQLMEKRAPQLTSAIIREFTGGSKGSSSSALGGNLRIQPQRFGPTPKAQTVMHDTVSSKGANLKARTHDVDALGVIDLWNTPDGKSMGIENHSPLCAHVRAGLFKNEIQVMLRGLFADVGDIRSLAPSFDDGDMAFIRSTRNIDFLVTESVMGRAISELTEGGRMRTLIRVNCAIVGWIDVTQDQAMTILLSARTRGIINWEVSIFPCPLGVEVECEAGTSLRPIVWTKTLVDLLKLFEEARGTPRLWSEEELLLEARTRGFISYLSPLEIQKRALAIAHDLHDLKSHWSAMEAKKTPFVAIELHPFLLHFGVTLGRIPFPQMGAAPRLTFPGMMIPQAAHMNPNASALKQSVSIAHTQRMPVETLAAKAFGPLMFTNSCVILVWAVAGCQDDAWILNKSSVERGLLSLNCRCVYSTTDNSNYRVVGKEWLESAKVVRLQRMIDGDRSQLDEFGVIKRGAKVYPNDTILFQRACTRKDSNGMITMFHDASMQHTRTTSVDDVWIVDKVVHGTPENGHRFEVHLARYVPPEVGDKFATVHGQKATVSQIWPQVDMPFCVDGPMAGVAPDIIMNTTAYSRMTVNNGVNILASTVAAQMGRILDGTPYEPFDIRALEEMSRSMGHHPGGKVLMRDGRTGEIIGDVRGDGKLEPSCYMAMGVVPIMRLWKHNPRTVIQACGHTTRRSATTGQPLKGRGQDGSAMRYGGLVRNAITAHGAPDINHDAVQRANMSSYPICGACGRVNPSAPYDYINMAAIKMVTAKELLQDMVDECEVCVYCRKPAVRETELPMVMQLISEITSALNMTLEYDIKPMEGQEIQEIIRSTRAEFLEKLNPDEFFALEPSTRQKLEEMSKRDGESEELNKKISTPPSRKDGHAPQPRHIVEEDSDIVLTM